MRVTVRFAENTPDREAIYRLRSEILNGEFGRGYLVDDEGRLTDELDGTARLLLAEHDGEVVGTIRLNWGGDAPFDVGDRAVYGMDVLERVVPANKILIFSRFAARAAHRGGDISGQLIDAMIRFALAQGVCLLLCDCRPQLINLYLRLGMRVFGAVVTTRVAGILIPMALLLDDPSHIEAAGSRIAPLLLGTSPNLHRRDALLALLPAEPAAGMLTRPEEAPEWTHIVDVLARTSLERFPIFQGLRTSDIARLTTRANVIGCDIGDVVLRKGSREAMVFVVLAGAVDVVQNGRMITQLQPGSVFGEVAFLAGVPRTADIVVAVPKSRLICLRPSTLAELITDEPALAAPFLFNLCRILAVRLAASASVAAAESAA